MCVLQNRSVPDVVSWNKFRTYHTSTVGEHCTVCFELAGMTIAVNIKKYIRSGLGFSHVSDSVPDLDPIRRSRKFLGPPGSITRRYGSGSFHHQAKIVRKNFISTIFVTLWLFFIEGHWRKEQDPDTDPNQNVTYPKHLFCSAIKPGRNHFWILIIFQMDEI